MIEGDFVASVKVTDYAGTAAAQVYHNNAGLMARAKLEDAGPGEDWVSIDYFPIWNCGNFIRSADDNVRTENANNGLAWNLLPWLQLERKGNTFHFRTSSDGVTWTEMERLAPRAGRSGEYPAASRALPGDILRNCRLCRLRQLQRRRSVRGPAQQGLQPQADGRSHRRPAGHDPELDARPVQPSPHDVYFGTARRRQRPAGPSKPMGVLVGRGQDANSYDPPACSSSARPTTGGSMKSTPTATIIQGRRLDLHGRACTPIRSRASRPPPPAQQQGYWTGEDHRRLGLNADDQHDTVTRTCG